MIRNQFEGTGTIDNSKFDVGSVNLEENALGTPPYVLPPGIEKTSSQRKCRCSKTKRSFSLYENQPSEWGSKRCFQKYRFRYEKIQNLELFVHAEDLIGKGSNLDKSAKFFIRFGSDATDNIRNMKLR